MGKHQETKVGYIYRVIVPKVTSLGASVVVIGALFKIMHWPGAGIMLTVGLSVESFLFFIGAFQPAPPPDKHYDWEKVYPELLEEATKTASKPKTDPNVGLAALPALDKMLSAANLTEDTFKNFGEGIKTLNASVSKMKDMTSVATASDEYTKNLQAASKSMIELNKAYSNTVAAMNTMANAANDAKAYHQQIQVITKNLGALNAVYEMELKDANSHLKAMNKFYSNLTVAMESMAEASKESQTFKAQMVALTNNLTNLNKVYGNMLAAMKG
ncbi:MAG: gliding motility protein GldL [Flammeovirgaceae bacterium]|nr:gliding motility protein GldL [Flammeovirgaceae bacterium]MDW8286957.1 gliding motility protein GldL [Flammeovirgaceae bacterium]